jgi:hypothetical protein
MLVADIIMTIPDAQVQRVLDAFAGQFQYDPNNPAHGTRAQFAKACMARYAKGVVVHWEAQQAQQSATAAAETQVTIT